jgi:hypothetical protein
MPPRALREAITLNDLNPPAAIAVGVAEAGLPLEAPVGQSVPPALDADDSILAQLRGSNPRARYRSRGVLGNQFRASLLRACSELDPTG